MSAVLGSILAFVGVVVTAAVSLIVGLRAGKTDAKAKEDQREIDLIDRYVAEIARIDKLLTDQRDTIASLNGSNAELTEQVKGLRSELEDMRDKHVSDLHRIEGKLNAARTYIGTLHEWVKRKVEDQHLVDVEGFPVPPASLIDDGLVIPDIVKPLNHKE